MTRRSATKQALAAPAKPTLVPLEEPMRAQLRSIEEILLGPRLLPQQYLETYSASDFEAFIQEWAFAFLQVKRGEYSRIDRIGGAGDKGRDIVAHVDQTNVGRLCDVFQCKHYRNPLEPNDIWIELGKLCYFTREGVYPLPRKYYFVATKDVGPKLAMLLSSPAQLNSGLRDAWAKCCATQIAKGRRIGLVGELAKYVEEFDFSCVTYKPIREIIEEHAQTTYAAQRFGGGLRPQFPDDMEPPSKPARDEARYVEHLLAAYADKLGRDKITLQDLADYAELREDYDRQRIRFYSTETLKRFAREALPPGCQKRMTFETLQDDVYYALVDAVMDRSHADAVERLVRAISIATNVQLDSHVLARYLSTKSRQGICHHLANEDKLCWVIK